MFADMKSFTAWSSDHKPEQVFTLLEIVYHSFDVIPNARKDHTVQMARFATKSLAMADGTAVPLSASHIGA
jgi:hypothetical protein